MQASVLILMKLNIPNAAAFLQTVIKHSENIIRAKSVHKSQFSDAGRRWNAVNMLIHMTKLNIRVNSFVLHFYDHFCNQAN